MPFDVNFSKTIKVRGVEVCLFARAEGDEVMRQAYGDYMQEEDEYVIQMNGSRFKDNGTRSVRFPPTKKGLRDALKHLQRITSR